ncbi:MAG TPA: hypothetical protein VFC70_03290 [Oscillospiraceae bacterium]|nr:hypothetical protein [Oscillospiraceae bacterium]
MGPPDDYVMYLYYDYEKNYFLDEMGFVVYDIFRYITPNELMVFKYYNEDIRIERSNGDIIELIASDLVFEDCEISLL